MPALSFTVTPYSLRLRVPFRASWGVLRRRQGFLLRITDPTGTAGWGEAAPLSGYGGESLERSAEALGEMVRWLEEGAAHDEADSGDGGDSTDEGDLSDHGDSSGPGGSSGHGDQRGRGDRSGQGGPSGQGGSTDRGNSSDWGSPPTLRVQAAGAAAPDAVPQTFESLRSLSGRAAERWPDAPAARAALDCALADLAARRAGLPMARWIDANARDHVWLNASIACVRPSRAGRRAAAAIDQGYRAVKVKLCGDDLTDLQRVASVRRAVGSRPVVRCDANGAWGENRAEVMLDALVAHAVEYVEQPVPAENVEALARLRRAAGTPVAADEALLEPERAEAVLAAEAADVLVLKPSLVGGICAAWSLAERAGARGMGVVVTTALEAAVGRVAALHLAAALPGADRPCGLATGDLLEADVAPAPAAEHGRMRVPSGPGLGLDVEEHVQPGMPDRTWRS